MAIFAVEARESLVDRNVVIVGTGSSHLGEARENLVDRNLLLVLLIMVLLCRGSREPRGSKYDVYDFAGWCSGRSRLARASWIEIKFQSLPHRRKRSRLARASWIEIFCF